SGGETIAVNSNTSFRNPSFTMERSEGTASLPLAINNGDTIATWVLAGHDGTAFGEAFDITATSTQTWTPSSRGSQVVFSIVKAGTTTPTTVLTLDKNGN